MFSKEMRYEINEGREISLVPGMERLRSEVLDELKPDTVLLFDSHWFTTVEFVITAHQRRAGKYTSEELPRGMVQVPFDLAGNPEFARLVADKVVAGGTKCHPSDDPCLPLNYPTINTAHYLNAGEAWISMSLPQTARDHNFLDVGNAISEAVAESDQRVVLIASGGMSHRFWSLDELVDHEASDPIHIITPEARAADEIRLEWWQQGDHARVIDNMDEYRQHKPEGMFGHYLMMVAAIGGRDCRAPGRLFSDYENATGTGQVHVWFDKPEAGWF
jgi:3,4-dihydroxyphenylacetate 2,3-dioxygenase